MSDDTRFDVLVAARLGGIATPAERAELLALLRASPGARRSYRRAVQTDAVLQRALGTERDLVPRVMGGLPTPSRKLRIVRNVIGSLPRRRIWPARIAWAAAAALVLLLSGTALLFLGGPPTASFEVAACGPGTAIIGANGRRAATAGAVLHPGERLETGSGGSAILRLREGAAEAGRFRCLPGSRVAILEPGPGPNLQLESGLLRAEVPTRPAGRPLRCSTPHADATILGTRFDLQADADATFLSVGEGQVRLSGGASSAIIASGAVGRADARGVAILRAHPLILATLPASTQGRWASEGHILRQDDAAALQTYLELGELPPGGIVIEGAVRGLAAGGGDGAFGLVFGPPVQTDGRSLLLLSSHWLRADRPWHDFRASIVREGQTLVCTVSFCLRDDTLTADLHERYTTTRPVGDGAAFALQTRHLAVEVADLRWYGR